MWDPGWDAVFLKHEWGKYPPEELVRFVARRFYSVPDRSSIRFLEVGCGPGGNLLYLAGEGFSVDGLDGSMVALERARKRLDERNLTAGLIRSDAVHPPFADEIYDCVIDIECLYANSMASTRQSLAEIHRMLKPGGWLFSKTFKTGTSGDGDGERLEGEANTWVRLKSGPLHSDYGPIRFTAEDEISDLYASFSQINYDYVIRSDRNRSMVVHEWLIACRK